MESIHRFTLQLIPLHDTFGKFHFSLFNSCFHLLSIPHFLPLFQFWLKRLKPGFEDCIEEVESEVKCKPEKLEWLLGFYTLPPNIQIASTKAYQEGKVTDFYFFYWKLFLCLAIFGFFFVNVLSFYKKLEKSIFLWFLLYFFCKFFYQLFTF